jgi:hypothetical protein
MNYLNGHCSQESRSNNDYFGSKKIQKKKKEQKSETAVFNKSKKLEKVRIIRAL